MKPQDQLLNMKEGMKLFVLYGIIIIVNMFMKRESYNILYSIYKFFFNLSILALTYREKKLCCGSRPMTAGGKERWSGKSARAVEREGGIGGMGGSGSDPATVSETHAAAQNHVAT